ncbi:MAG: glutathione synthase, partial [Sinobacteraceae bacterium]|nr:glutathione synthase [Nevskiaceae bacterium]
IPDIIETGDARVLLVDGEPVPYALARIPSATDHRGNLAAGAKGVARPLTERDRWLAGQIGPALAAKGMLFVGLDVIGGFVTEINVTSPTGIRELQKQFGVDAADLLIQCIARRLQAHRRGRS